MITIRTIDALGLEPGSRVFYRVDYNVPLEGSEITDATRIEETKRTIEALRKRGAALVIASHLGRPKGERKEKYSLKPVRERLAKMVGTDVQWADDCIGADAEAKAGSLKAGEILLLENLRFHAGEEKNDATFAAGLRKLAQFYVNDAFGASHRAHASIDALPRLFPKTNTAGGLLLARELEFLQKVTAASDHPFVALLGGAKIAGKIEPLEALLKMADLVLIGGGMANTFLAARGLAMGGSLVDADSLDVAERILKSGARVLLPTDLVVADSMDAPTKIETVKVDKGLSAAQKAFDIGPDTIDRYASEIGKARIVFWNGPMGVFEKEQFAKGTMAMARAVANSSGISVVGGGESVEAVKKSGFADKISHISTGGGASLEFIAGASLPGVEILSKG
jgi:phosphoglycerate kinase